MDDKSNLYEFDGISLKCSPIEMQRLKRTFDWIDIEKDGKLSGHEIRVALQKLGYTAKHREVETMIWEVDDNLDGFVSWDEVLATYQRVTSDQTGYEPIKLFSLIEYLMLDKTFSACISVEDTLEILYCRHGRDKLEKEIQELFGEGSTKNYQQPQLTYVAYLQRLDARLKQLRSRKDYINYPTQSNMKRLPSSSKQEKSIEKLRASTNTSPEQPTRRRGTKNQQSTRAK